MSRRLAHWPIWLFLLLCLTAQQVFFRQSEDLHPAIEEMPLPLTPHAMKALAFGDQQFLFRYLGLWLQGVGDGGGRIRPLREYDYTRVVSWLQSLDGLDPRSDYVPALAAHYFGAIMVDPGKVKVIVQYLVERAQSDLARGWPWLVWAAEKSMHVIKEKPLCSALAARFYGFRDSTEVPQVLAMFATPLYRCAEDKFMMLALQADPKMRALRQHAAEEMGALLAEHPF